MELSQETKDLFLRRSLINEIPLIISLVLVAALGLYLSLLWPDSIQSVQLGKLGDKEINISIPFFGLMPLMLFFVLWHRIFNAKYVIAIDHVRSVNGFLSTRLKDLRIDYENIRGIEIERSLFQRFFNLGDIHIGSAMHADVEISMIGIWGPGKYRAIMEERIRENYHRLNQRSTQISKAT